MCAIGALMGPEQDVATMLSAQVEELVQADEQGSLDCHRLDRYEYIMPPSEQTKRTSHAHPIWLLQTKLPLIWFRAFCGNPYVVTDALKEFGFLVNAYWDRMSDVRADPHFDKHRTSPYSDWHSWCQFELTKRLLHSIFILSNLLTAAYGATPALSAFQDGDIELPCHDNLWNAPTEELWKERISLSLYTRQVSLKVGVTQLMGGAPNDLWKNGPHIFWSPFAAVVIMYGISIHLWHKSQILLPISASPPFEQTQDLKSLILDGAAEALSRCHEHILRARDAQCVPWTDSEGPLLFNCCSILRLCHLRAVADVGILGVALLQTSPPVITQALHNFISTPPQRNAIVVKAINKTLEGLVLPCTIGGNYLSKKTAALTWSIETAILSGTAVSLTIGLFLMRWVHWMEMLVKKRIELEQSEALLLNHIRNHCLELEIIEAGTISLAAGIGKYYATYYDDTWVWRITPRIATVLREMGSLCESETRISSPLNHDMCANIPA